MNVRVDGHSFEVVIEDMNATPVVAIVDGQRIEVWPDTRPGPASASTSVPAPGSQQSSRDTAVYAPIPGVIIGISVSPGDVVAYGQELCVLEAMKMKQAIRAAREGRVEQVCVTAGQHVAHREVLITYSE